MKEKGPGCFFKPNIFFHIFIRRREEGGKDVNQMITSRYLGNVNIHIRDKSVSLVGELWVI